MREFSFRLPTRIEFGDGQSRRVGVEAKGLGGTRALVVTDPGVKAAGLVDAVIEDLERAAVAAVLFDDVSPNPRDTQVMRGVELAAAEGCDLLVAVGGGSPMDVAKAVGVVLAHGGRIQDHEGRGTVSRLIMPLVAIPTTAGTGSEVSFSSVITDTERSFKMSVGSPLIAAAVALVDPLLTAGLPPRITAYTGMDALSHAVEAFTATSSEPLTDSLALRAIELVGANLRQACANGEDKAARGGMMLASLLAGIAFCNTDVAGVHCIGEAIGGLYDTPHGVAMAIYLPVVVDFNRPARPEKYAAIARALCGAAMGLPTPDAAESAAVAIRALSRDLDIPRASDVGVRPEDFARLARAAAANGSVKSNPRVVTEDDFYAMLEAAQREGQAK